MAIVISPVNFLLMDQIQRLPKQIAGVAYNSSLNLDQKLKILQLIKEGKVKILYISPETLQSDFPYLFKCLPEISYVCIDEAHCVSEWSHKFYLIREMLKCNQIIALSSTATIQTEQSILEKLNISKEKIIKGQSIIRNNLQMSISRDKNKDQAALQLIKHLLLKDTESIIIFCQEDVNYL